MKTKVQVYRPQNEKQPRLPVELGNARGAALNITSINMRLFGIARITIVHKIVGLKTMTDVSFEPLPGNLPPSLEACRNTIVRHLGDYMHLFGILDVQIMPDANELQVIQAAWVQLQQMPPVQSESEVPGVDSIELNIESDPSTESVLAPTEPPAGEGMPDEPSTTD